MPFRRQPPSRPVPQLLRRKPETDMASKNMNVDLNSVFEGAAAQFRGLNPNEPGQWPALPKLVTWFILGVAVVVVGWFLLLSSANDELEAERAKEPTLKTDYRN